VPKKPKKMTKKEAHQYISALDEAPHIIKSAREMISKLPKGEIRDDLIRKFLNLKKALISLDVKLEDIEWSICQKMVKELMNE